MLNLLNYVSSAAIVRKQHGKQFHVSFTYLNILLLVDISVDGHTLRSSASAIDEYHISRVWSLVTSKNLVL